MDIIKDETYEEMAATYQCLEIAQLNETLKQCGIADAKLRQKICSEFVFSSGAFLDSGWFVSDGVRLYPELCFAERPLDDEVGLGDEEILHVPSHDSSLRKYTGANITWYFEEHNEDVSEIEHGNL